MEPSIAKCSCGETKFLQVLPKFNRYQVHCVNCGNTGIAKLTKEEAIISWAKSRENGSK